MPLLTAGAGLQWPDTVGRHAAVNGFVPYDAELHLGKLADWQPVPLSPKFSTTPYMSLK